MKTAALLLTALLSGSAVAQVPPASSASEITQLFSALGNSKCEFSHNGTWYGADKAVAHLHRKYDYLAKKRLVTSTESFIDLAASRSSMSGKPYLVRCGGGAPLPSKVWFTDRLKEIRNVRTKAGQHR